MVEKISIEVGLEGGEDVRKTLEEIVDRIDGVKTAAGELGETDATVDIKAEGADEAKAKIDGVKTAAEELGQIDATVKVNAEGAAEAKGALDPLSQMATLVGTGFEAMSLKMARGGTAAAQAGVALGGLTTTVDSLGVAAERMGARMTRSLGLFGVFARALGPVGIAVGVLAGALVRFGDFSADALNKLTVESAKLGLTAQQFDILQQSLTKLGISQDAVAAGSEKLKGLIGGGLDRLGDIVPPDKLAGLQQFIAQLERMPDGIQRTKLAIDTLGEALGGQVIAGLQTGTISAQNFAAAVAGVTPATQQQIVEAAKYQQSLNQLNTAWTELKTSITPIATPVFEFLTQELKNLKKDLNELAQQWQLIKAVFQVFKAGITGGDIGEAAKQAAEEYKKATAALQQTGQTAVQTGQQVAQIGQQGGQAFKTWGDLLAAAGGDANKAAEALKQLQAGQQQTGSAAQQSGQQVATGAQTATQAYESLGTKVQEVSQKVAQQLPAPTIAPIDWSPVTQGLDATIQSITNAFASIDFSSLQAIDLSAAITAFNAIKEAVDAAKAAVETFASTLTAITWDAISGAGVAAWNALAAAIQTATDKLAEFQRKQSQTGAPQTGGGAPGKARGGLLGGRGTGTSDSNLAWLSRGEYVMPASAVRQPGVLSFLEALRRSGRIPGFAEGGPVSASPDVFGPIGQSLRSVFEQLRSAVDGMNQAMGPLHENLANVMDELGRALGNAFDTAKQGIGQIESALGNSMNAVAQTIVQAMENLSTIIQGIEQKATGKARGGLLGGRGTGTSDSNLAWVSRGEHVMPARAVAQPGVLAFLEALRRSGGNLRAVLDGMGHFALGGMVPGRMAFATGGLAGGMSNVTIQFPGLPAISGLRASSDVVDQLHKAAALAQVRSGGRKPSRYS